MNTQTIQMTSAAPFMGAAHFQNRFSPRPFRKQLRGPALRQNAVDLTTTEKAVVVGGVALGTGVSALIAYYGLQAGLKEKGFLSVLGWVFGVPAAFSGLLGVTSLLSLGFEGFPSAPTPPAA